MYMMTLTHLLEQGQMALWGFNSIELYQYNYIYALCLSKLKKHWQPPHNATSPARVPL